MHELKGEPRSVISGLSGPAKVDLVVYADHSHGIMRDGRVLGVWEPDEIEDCARLFLRFVMPEEETENATSVIETLQATVEAQPRAN